jgi:hypothetical protein
VSQRGRCAIQALACGFTSAILLSFVSLLACWSTGGTVRSVQSTQKCAVGSRRFQWPLLADDILSACPAAGLDRGHLGLPLLIWWVDTMTNSE